MVETAFSALEDEQVLEKLLQQAKKDDAVGGPDLSPGLISLLEQCVRFGTGDNRLWKEPDKLYRRAINSWTIGAIRKPHTHIISIKTIEETALSDDEQQGQQLMLNICCDDKPFLVDSITAALTDFGKTMNFFMNAVVETHRDEDGVRIDHDKKKSGTVLRESIIHAELDPAIDEVEIFALKEELDRVLDDICVAVDDWQDMRARLKNATLNMNKAPTSKDAQISAKEAVAFLEWLADNHFAFMGVRHYRIDHRSDQILFEHDPSGDLGVLKDSSLRILKNTYSQRGELSEAVEEFLSSDEIILVAKANSKSKVHRRTYHDYIGVKIYDENGKMVGEDRFIGLFTSDVYNRPALNIPYIRAKVDNVLSSSPFAQSSHNEKALLNILETYPRDELFQVDVDTLSESALEILRLYKRPRIKLILRRDRFDRFLSAFVFIPRDLFNSDRREAIGALLANTFQGRISAFYPYFSDASLVRVHFIIGIDVGAPKGPGVQSLTRSIREICRDWNHDLLAELNVPRNGKTPKNLFPRYQRAFPPGYQDTTTAQEALDDIFALEQFCNEQLNPASHLVRAYKKDADTSSCFRLKLYKHDNPMRLSDLIPTLENFGLSVIKEDSFEISPNGHNNGNKIWLHDFKTSEKNNQEINLDTVQKNFEEALRAILSEECEDDGFNALVLLSGINWREAWILRTAAKHHLQTGFAYSQSYIENTLAKYPAITANLVEAFHAKFCPDDKSIKQKQSAFKAKVAKITQSLKNVHSLDDDRIIRRFLNLFNAITRTNFYQTDKDGKHHPCVSIKIDSNKLEEIPEPKPYREIFVSGPIIDGVHLRFGPVARGGLRWSDRKEDFRTEILGLVKAQRVKNAVIVPTGSKGGFYPKKLPATDDRAVTFEAGRDAYKVFIKSLLQITDNIVDGEITPPHNVIVHDDLDPYLVVAADKGTALFSDTANEIATEHGFWLDDAFASGGSVGYDHKAMGITARGAWEAVKRHFREMGRDIQNEAFTVAGVGDMSGDVFGNGMLLSRHIKLLAAFDHRDIFIDPNPDPETSWKERKRIFELKRSSWKDYNPKLISKGGGVFSRNEKAITLSEEIQSYLGIDDDTLSPNELITAILKSKIELFWLGGIGTYFKHDNEENWRVGDRANDAIRINVSDMNMAVIGEGANLGLTQPARIDYARKGGRINTDAIDNSAGVDSSDHEVNIKILLRAAIEQGELEAKDRNQLLATMTDDVARHVLHHNYTQTRALSILQARAHEDIDAQSRFLTELESQGRINRTVEDLPTADALEAMAAQYTHNAGTGTAQGSTGGGLTRPELSVLLAYTKLWLMDEIVVSDVPDDPILHRELENYFPKAIRGFKKALGKHRLRREIIAMRMANEIVDTCGITFIHEAMQVTGASIREIVLCYEAARRIFNMAKFAKEVDNLDNQISAQAQISLYYEATTLLKAQVYRLATDIKTLDLIEDKGLTALIELYRKPVNLLRQSYYDFASIDATKIASNQSSAWKQHGISDELAKEVSLFTALERALDIVDIAKDTNKPYDLVAQLFFGVGRKLKLDILHNRLRNLALNDSFDRRATQRLIDEITRQQKTLTHNLIDSISPWPKKPKENWADLALEKWIQNNQDAMARFERFLNEIDIEAQTPTVSKLSLLSVYLTELSKRTS